MAFEIEVKNKVLKIKFDFRTMFKANKKLASNNPETGQKNNDGASNLFSRILEEDEEAVFDLIRLVDGRKLKEDDLFDAIEDYVSDYNNVSEGYTALFGGIKEEMLDSGFFLKKIQKQIENMERGKEMLKKRDDEQSKMQVEALDGMLSSMKKEVSSALAQEED